MPLPSPGKNENERKFIDRCMGNGVMVSEYPDGKQRFAVCNSQWKRKSKNSKSDKLLEKEKDNVSVHPTA